jgi:hypothetical protein
MIDAVVIISERKGLGQTRKILLEDMLEAGTRCVDEAVGPPGSASYVEHVFHGVSKALARAGVFFDFEQVVENGKLCLWGTRADVEVGHGSVGATRMWRGGLAATEGEDAKTESGCVKMTTDSFIWCRVDYYYS